MRHSCYYERTDNLSLIRDLTHLGAEFNEKLWQSHWVGVIDTWVRANCGEVATAPKHLHQLLIESMRGVSEFAEGA